MTDTRRGENMYFLNRRAVMQLVVLLTQGSCCRTVCLPRSCPRSPGGLAGEPA